MKRYYFNNESWWDKPECDCCESVLMECYNIDTDRHPEMLQNGSVHSIEDCMIDILDHHKIINAESDWREYHGIENWKEERKWLLMILQDYNLQVAIENENGEWEIFP